MKKLFITLLIPALALSGFYLIKIFWPKNGKPLLTDEERQIIIIDAQTNKAKAEFVVELAKTQAQREQGLMFRTNLDLDKGMLFIFDDQKIRKFWMKDTYIPLDMVFISSDGQIVGIVENAKPKSLTPQFVNQLSQYVLEINGGLAKKYDINTGDLIKNLP